MDILRDACIQGLSGNEEVALEMFKEAILQSPRDLVMGRRALKNFPSGWQSDLDVLGEFDDDMILFLLNNIRSRTLNLDRWNLLVSVARLTGRMRMGWRKRGVMCKRRMLCWILWISWRRLQCFHLILASFSVINTLNRFLYGYRIRISEDGFQDGLIRVLWLNATHQRQKSRYHPQRQ
jgi:hypothetical protein